VSTVVKRSRKRVAATRPSFDDELCSILERAADKLDPPPDPYAEDPVGWVHDRLGEETWSLQREILTSLRDNPKTAVRSAHSIGKSHIASRAVAWWGSVHPVDEVFVVTTAPSAPQVKAILWRYVKSAHRKGALGGYITEGEIPEWKVEGRLIGWGRKPQALTNEEEAKTAFQGIHAKFVLVVIDEAGGVPKWLYDAIQTLVTSPTNRVLAIGNPDDASSHFARINEPGSGWNVLKISAFDAPAFTGEEVSDDLAAVLVSREWVETVRREWGEDNPLYISKVLAEFPTVSDDSLITPAMITRSVAAFGELDGTAMGRYAADIARLGRDKTVVYRNRGGVMTKVAEWSRKTTDVTTAKLRKILAPHQRGVPMVIDITGGLGAGPFDNLKREGYSVVPWNSSEAPMSKTFPRSDMLRFKNRRAEQYWTLRELMDSGEIGIEPGDLDAQAQLVGIKWWIDTQGKICLESKEDMIKRLGRSPDHADAIMMATVPTDEWELVSQDIAANPHTSSHLPSAKSETGDLLGRTW
jgi:hypothetical protein